MCNYCVDQWGKNTYDDQEKVLKITEMYKNFQLRSIESKLGGSTTRNVSATKESSSATIMLFPHLRSGFQI